MLTLPITPGKRYVRRDGKTITALPTTDIPALADYNEDLICVATAQEADLNDRTTQERLAYPQTGAVSNGYYKHPYDLVADAVDTNPHAALIDQYANDWKTCSSPWENWQCLSGLGGNERWEDLEMHPCWMHHMQYRHKPQTETITLNGITLNAPMRQAPEAVTKAWCMPLCTPYEVVVGPDLSKETLSQNDIFHTREDAEAARLAIIAALGTSKEIT